MKAAGPILTKPVTICVLLYGDHPNLAERAIGSIIRHTSSEAFRLRVGANAVSATTLKVIDYWARRKPFELSVSSHTNLYKAAMMRRPFFDAALNDEWTIWFDDDSYVFRQDWLAMLENESRLKPDVGMWGSKQFIRVGDDHCDFIREASWYRGIEPALDDQPKHWRLSFIAGGFWAIRSALLQLLNWPDPRLIHFGDDYMLGEALRQNGVSIGNAFSGVEINRERRRAPADTPRSCVLS